MTNAALNSIPTINLTEVVRVVTPNGAYDAEVLLTFADGSRNIASTENGTVRILRVGATTRTVHQSN
jgi:hypothetical protein